MISLKTAYVYLSAVKINLIKAIKKVYFTTNFYRKTLNSKIPGQFYFIPNPFLMSCFTTYKDFAIKLENIDPKIIFYCPILNELDSSFFNLFNRSIKICNLQGFMRKTVNQSIQIKKNLPNINFKIFDAVILSEIDTNFENALKISSYSKIVCYTMGKKGVKIIIDNEIIAFKTLNVINNDETGAGDVWGTSFIIFYYLMKKDLNESVSLSNISASLSVTGISDKKIPKYNEILKHYNA